MIDTAEILPLVPPYLARQRWFAGAQPDEVRIVREEALTDRMCWVLVAARDALYQLLLAEVDLGDVPEFLHGRENDVLGTAEGVLVYDALVDAELARVLLTRLLPSEDVRLVRPLGVEQSNTSLVFDDRLVLKLFRRVREGHNPDIEVTSALAACGFSNIAVPLAVWRRDEFDLAVVQPYLAGGTDGFALVLTSVRDYFGGGGGDPASSGGDFAAEAARLGEVTARMHVAMLDAFGAGEADTTAWVDRMERDLDGVAAGLPWTEPARAVVRDLATIASPGPAIRVHGDYHLGQVMRTDAGWFILDFEGEPTRSLHERVARTSALKDVAGMLRSFHYATAVAMREQRESDHESLVGLAAAWEERNRHAFLAGYLGTEGVESLLPPEPADVERALVAWELDKAVYELAYEQAYRPDWAAIPEAAIRRLVGG